MAPISRRGDAIRPRSVTPSSSPSFVWQGSVAVDISDCQAFADRYGEEPLDKTKGTIDSAKTQKTDSGKAFAGTIVGVEKGGATPTGDQSMLLAPNHAELMAKRDVGS